MTLVGDLEQKADELVEFTSQICEFYHLGAETGNFDQEEFINWVVLRAGCLYMKYEIQTQDLDS